MGKFSTLHRDVVYSKLVKSFEDVSWFFNFH